MNRFKSHRHIQLLSACALAAATAVFSAGPAEAAGREVTVSIANMRYAQIPAGGEVARQRACGRVEVSHHARLFRRPDAVRLENIGLA